MKENISTQVKEVLGKYDKLSENKRLYFTSIILNHINCGLINEGNYLDSDVAYENDKLVLEPQFIGLENDIDLTTKLLLTAAQMDNVVINPNGIDIEPYVKDMSDIKPILSQFYKLEFCDKLDFIAEIIYDISSIEAVKTIDFNFNGLINEIISFRQENFGCSDKDSLEVE